ncbi:polyamine-transporting ATPase 13A3 [Condylostylus longicornis]|uniref:polyamine-transporting ATPase 13A3 n=1 Tax=Condylostylus longicornis TaxID=2530218 RepID=UPI00244E0B3B|nr:polyamine-transporting ATPase 13A3 [Condylostylus longicornis]
MPITPNTKGFQRSQYSPFRNQINSIDILDDNNDENVFNNYDDDNNIKKSLSINLDNNKQNFDNNTATTTQTTAMKTMKNIKNRRFDSGISVINNSINCDINYAGTSNSGINNTIQTTTVAGTATTTTQSTNINKNNNLNNIIIDDCEQQPIMSGCGGNETDDLVISEYLIEETRSSCYAVLNSGEDDEMQITGYRRSILKTILCYIGVILTGGILRLVMHWWKHWYVLATHSKCPLDQAEKILILEDYQGKHQIYYVKDVITLNLETVREMKKKPEKWEKHFPIHDTFDEKEFYLSIHFSSGSFRHTDSIKLFRCKQLRYIWDIQTQSFQKLQGLDVNLTSTILHQRKGLTEQEQLSRRFVYGINEISVPMKGVMTLLFLEVLNPFYVFQIFSVCLWLAYNYYYYAAVIVLMSAFGIIMSILQTKKNQDALQNTVHNSDCALVVSENGEIHNTETRNLVPGDIIEIPSSGCLMQCDAVLLSGNCILDESMLTGESVPVTKTPLPLKRDLLFDKKEHSRHTLFSGTKVMQTRYIGSEKVLAVVINTGNITAKGGLIRSILYPPPVDYKFEQDSYKFITLLAIIAGLGFVYTLVTKIQRAVSATKIAIEALDLITIAVPPALPAAMTVGRYYAQKRLERSNIYCISPRTINVSGSIDCVCFDKTGTLTEDGLDMWGVVPKSSTNQFQIPLKQIERLPHDHLLKGMVTCHSITIMNGVMKGDPLDLKMFESTGWQLEEANVADDNKYDLLFPTIVRKPKSNSLSKLTTDSTDNICMERNFDTALLPSAQSVNSFEEDIISQADDIGIVREFPFSSNLQRMSVITRRLGDNHFNVYCKGAPEMIQSLCKSESVPDNYLHQLDIYAQQGYRIISIAYKPLDKKMTYPKVQRIARDKIECDLEFLGFVILENRLKPDTTDVIHSLNMANVRTIMVTGDNILTAISVAKDCGMIPKHQSIITINTKPAATDSGKYELYYTLSGANVNPTNPAITPNGNGDITSYMTNSNSVASLETVDTWTCAQRDVELGGDGIGFKSDMTPSTTIKGSLSAITPSSITAKPLIDQSPNDYLLNNYRFAMVGKTWAIVREHFPDLLSKFVTRGTIFARMSPDQKQALILELQNLGYYVAMCGDGANDCGALKAAHTGISLSEAESSVASPFTSRNPTISCVPNVIKEGRAALVTSFGIFKYMAAYSLVQFVSVLILYSIDSNLTDIQFLYIDLFLISIFAFFFGQTGAYDGTLVKQPPLNSLVALSPIASLILHLTVIITMQTIGWYHVQSEPWFEPFNFSATEDENDLACYENYTIFVISCFQYVILAFVFSKGAPYRRPITSNIPFLLALLINLVVILYLTLIPHEPIANFFELKVPDDFNFRGFLIGYGAVNFILAIFIECFIVEYLLFKKFQKSQFSINYEKQHRKYLQMEDELKHNMKWPPISYYNSDIQSSNYENGEDKSSPISYAEISAEHTIDMKAPENSVLNNFFEQTTNPNTKQLGNFPHTDLDDIDDVTDYDENQELPFSLPQSELSDYESAQNILLESPQNSGNSENSIHGKVTTTENSSSNIYDSTDDVYHPTIDKSIESLGAIDKTSHQKTINSSKKHLNLDQLHSNKSSPTINIHVQNIDENPKKRQCVSNSYNSLNKQQRHSPVNGIEMTNNESILLQNHHNPTIIGINLSNKNLNKNILSDTKINSNESKNLYQSDVINGSRTSRNYDDFGDEIINSSLGDNSCKNCNIIQKNQINCKNNISNNSLSGINLSNNNCQKEINNLDIIETKIDKNEDDKLS